MSGKRGQVPYVLLRSSQECPYEYLPSGKRYQEGWLMPGLDFATDVWGDVEWQVAAARHRFILQIQALDGWLGALLGE